MGKFNGQNYYPDKDDGELQWLEDGIGLLGLILIKSISLLFLSVCQLLLSVTVTPQYAETSETFPLRGEYTTRYIYPRKRKRKRRRQWPTSVETLNCIKKDDSPQYVAHYVARDRIST